MEKPKKKNLETYRKVEGIYEGSNPRRSVGLKFAIKTKDTYIAENSNRYTVQDIIPP
jgi:hypothetical protein